MSDQTSYNRATVNLYAECKEKHEMGYIAHHAIIVTAETRSIRVFHAQAVATFAGTCAKVTAPTEAGMNATSSFLIAPDGSKEGWADSDAGDAARAAFIDYLTADQYYCVDWVEVRFGGDDSDTQTYVTRHSGDDEYYAERERLRAMRAEVQP